MRGGYTEDTGSIVDINSERVLVVFIVATEVDETNLKISVEELVWAAQTQ